MNGDDKKQTVSESDGSGAGGTMIGVPATSGTVNAEKRTLPLLYVQSPVSKSSIAVTNCSDTVSYCTTKMTGTTSVSPVSNGTSPNPKLIQVKNSGQNIAYVGTLFKPPLKGGKECMPQKVLLTPIKGKKGPVARLILPRPNANANGSSSVLLPPQKLCRSFVVSSMPQTSIVKTALAKAGTEMTKITGHPSIIRHRATGSAPPEGGRVLATSPLIKPATGNSPLALAPSDKPVKLIILDMKPEDCNQPSPEQTKPAPSSPKKESSDHENEDCQVVPVKSTPENTEDSKTDLLKNGRLGSPTPSVESRTEENSSQSDGTGSTTPSSSAGVSSQPEGARKRKGSLLSCEPVKKAPFLYKQQENIKLLPGAEEFDPFEFIEWDSSGVGKIPSSSIKVTLNEFGMFEVYEGSHSSVESKMSLKASAVESAKKDEIFCCVACGCYGLLNEFYNENYCSVGCRDNLIARQHAIVRKNDKVLPEKAPAMIKQKRKPSTESNNGSSKKSGTGIIQKTINKNFEAVDEMMCLDDDVELVNLEEDTTSSEQQPEKTVPNKNINNINKNNNSINNEAKFIKVKKIITKGYKINGSKNNIRSTISGSNSSQMNNKVAKLKALNEALECKVTLRPKSMKTVKSFILSDLVTHDLDMGLNIRGEKESPKKKTIGFQWSSYLNETKSNPAWVKLFTNPFPARPNRFRCGYKLEVIDPEHQKYICPVTVSEVKGYRIKLSFDGYPKDYDFWANVDSPGLFPCNFSKKHKIKLQLPPTWNSRNFDWISHLVRHNYKPAPPHCFENLSGKMRPNLFKVDMKLEAVDRKNTYLVCVGTVAAVMEDRILVHFDSWGDMYDYWTDIGSPYIRPVGWCQANNHALTPPNDRASPDIGMVNGEFCWKQYLKDTKSMAAPEKAFALRPPLDFRRGMKLEAVDRRAPHLLRVATVTEVLPYQLKISFDGFPLHFAYWVDDDSPEIHPVGWALRTGHPLEPPPEASDLLAAACPTPGCLGQGFFGGLKAQNHSDIKHCPFTTDNLAKEVSRTDRIKWLTSKNKSECASESEVSENESEELESQKWSWIKVRQDLMKDAKRVPDQVNYDISKDEESTRQTVLKGDPERESKIDGISVDKKVVIKQENEETAKDIAPANNSVDVVMAIGQEKEHSIVNVGEEKESTVGDTGQEKESTIGDIGQEKESTVGDIGQEKENSITNIDKEKMNTVTHIEFEKVAEIDKETSVVKVKEEVEEFPEELLEDSLKQIEIMETDTDISANEKVTEEEEKSPDPVRIKLEVEEEEEEISQRSATTSEEEAIDNSLIEEEEEDMEDDGVSRESAPPERNNGDTPISVGEESDRSSNSSSGSGGGSGSNMGDGDTQLALEEEKAVYWDIHQVCRFAKPLISSSSDCFLEQEIDGSSLLMMTKNDLLQNLGLNDIDADRVFNGIRTLRQKIT